MPMCGRTNQRVARPGLMPHVHKDAFEICLIDRGEVDWWVEDHTFTLSAGQVSVTRPGERHGGVGSTVHPCELYWFQVGAKNGDRELETLLTTLGASPVRVLDVDERVRDAMRTLIDEHRQPSSAFAPVAAAAAMRTVLVGIVRTASMSREPLSAPVVMARGWISANLNLPVRVADAAAAAGLSVARLQVRFKAELNCSVGEYWNRQRLQQAKRLLGGGEKPITAIAHDLGFATSQYFATFFGQRVGVSPREYRKLTSR